MRGAGSVARLGLLGLSTLAALALAELGLRAAWDPRWELSADRIWEAQAGAPEGRERGHRTRIGGVSFREDDVDPRAYDPGVTRILFLGDSFTYGAGVPDPADRFPDRLEERLNRAAAERGETRRFHVFNAGKGNTEPVAWRRFFRAVAPVYRPHRVVAVFFLRDGAPLGTSLARNRALIEPITARYARWPLFGRSALVRFFAHRLAWRDFSRDYQRRLRRAYLGDEAERRTWEVQQEALVEIAEAARRRGASFHLVVFPLLFDLDDYAFFDVEAEIARFAERNGIPFFSLTPGFLGRDAASLWVASNDQHPNAEAHRIAAETLLPYLSRGNVESAGDEAVPASRGNVESAGDEVVPSRARGGAQWEDSTERQP